MIKVAFRQGGQIRLKNCERPALPADHIRVRVNACGICGTDLHHDAAQSVAEQPFGHEIAGTILEVGRNVSGVTVGQKIVLDSATPCGWCDACRNGEQELCTDLKSFFITGSFGFAEEMIAPAICAIPCEDLSPDVACLQEPLGVAIDLVRLADIRTSSNVLVIGPGPIGLMAMRLAKRAGAARVFVSGFAREAARVELARRWGADDIIEPTALSKHAFGCKIDRVLVTAPPSTLNDAFWVAAKGGIISFIGIGHGEQAFCRFDANAFHFKKLQLRASFASPAMFGPRALQYLRDGTVRGEELISHRFPLEQIAEAMRTAQDATRALKVVVTNP